MNRLRQIQFAAIGWIIALLVVSLHEGSFAQSKVGTTAAQFLGISVGPRAMAMGGAYVGESQDVTAIYWNPGAFVQSGKTQFAFSNTDWLVGSKFRWFGLMYNADGANALGISLTQLDYGSDEVTTVQSPEGTGQQWSAQDLAIGLSYSHRLTDNFSLGGSAKYISQSIWNETASSFTFDAGLLYVTGFNGMRLGMSMSNFGGDLAMSGSDLLQRVDIDPNNPGGNKTLVANMKTDPWPMPLLFRVGVAMDAIKTEDVSLTVVGDALRPSDNDMSFNFGGEIGWHNMLFARGGYQSLVTMNSQEQLGWRSSNSEQGLSLGAGIKYATSDIGTLEVNYAFTKFGVFDNLSTFEVAIGF